MGESRIQYAAKNFAWGTFSNIINSILGFFSRTVFVYTLGETYLGVNGLFSNILGLLSLAELGIGSAISFSLYKPLAEHDTKKLQAIIHFYKTAYRFVAIVIAAVGLCIVPFLKYIIKGAEGIENTQLIYCIFLFNTVSSYLISYKSTILAADQKNYLLTNINIIVKIIVTIAQISILLVFRDFIIYLLVESVVQLLGKYYINYFVNTKYPYLKGKNSERLSQEEKRTIFTKVKALVVHKMGEVAINQTDNIITSAFVSITAVGLVSNFVMIINIINSFIMSFFNSATAGLGNLIATEDEQTRYQVSRYYDFLGFVFFGWSAIVLYFCLSPFISIWLGEERLIDEVTVALLCINYYLTGARVPLSNMKIAAGIYEQDQWVPLAQALTNIVVSIVGAQYLGLKGIYIGTLVSSMLPNFIRPTVVYKYVFNKKSGIYFKNYLFRIVLLLCCVVIINLVLKYVHNGSIYINFIIIAFVSAITPLMMICIVFRNTEEFNYIRSLIETLFKSLLRKYKG